MQDELHLIEGPLGSLVGIYETALDVLCEAEDGCKVKYIASTATIRKAEDQVQCVFARRLSLFPPPGLNGYDRFFLRQDERHPLEDGEPGRLYVGVCAPGRGPLTPLVRIVARLLQTAHDHTDLEIDAYWTLATYFNAIRELAGARALYRQDIPERLREISADPRTISEQDCEELSGRKDSTELPSILDHLTTAYPAAPDALFTTSMFGTGIDIPRIGMMVVNGQPKTTSSYIQSTGLGRAAGGLIVTFLRASRPRDLNHYEFFCGYHRQLNRFVEPITAFPFAPGAMARALGPVAVFILRNMQATAESWCSEDSAGSMADARGSAQEVLLLPDVLTDRASVQSDFRRPDAEEVRQLTEAALDLWQQIARRNKGRLQYVEYAIARAPENPVVLGDSQHRYCNFDVVYDNAPQSLREIEETLTFQT
jgi:hypothetical protein